MGKGAHSVTIKWLIPHICEDGHHMHQGGFLVYVKPKRTRAEWKLVTSVDHYLIKLTVGDLKADKEYYLGVAGFNDSGVGEIVGTEEATSSDRK